MSLVINRFDGFLPVNQLMEQKENIAELNRQIQQLLDSSISDESQLQRHLKQLQNDLSLDELKQLVKHKKNVEPETFFEQIKAQLEAQSFEWTSVEKETSFLSHLKKDLCTFINYIKNLINMFVDTLNTLNASRNGMSLWDRQALFFIVLRFLIIPSLIIQAIMPLLGASLKVYFIGCGIIAVAGIALYAYQKLVRPNIDSLSYSENLHIEIKEKRIQRHVADQIQIKKVADLLHSHIMLVGVPGVGKTSIVESIVQLIEDEKKLPADQRTLPKTLANKTIWRVGCKELNTRGYNKAEPLTKIKNEIRGHEDEVILFFDEIHTLLNSADVVDGLKILLNQKGLVCVGVTSSKEWEAITARFDKDKALSSRWKVYEVKTPSNEEIELILWNLYAQKSTEILRKEGIYIPLEKEAINKIVKLSRNYFSEEGISRIAYNCLRDLMNDCQIAYRPNYSIEELEQYKIEQRLIQARLLSSENQYLQSENKLIALQSELENRKAAAKRIQDLKKREVQLKKESFSLLPSFDKSENAQKLFILYQCYLRPTIQQLMNREIEAWQGKMRLMIDEEQIKQYFEAPRKELKKEEK